MLLIDFSQVTVASLMADLARHNTTEISLGMLRNSFFNALLGFRKKWPSRDYGNIILCADGSGYWRKKIFPYYKSDRAKARAKSPYDWEKIHECRKTLIDEIRKNFPYRIIQIPETEADDIIAILCKYSKPEKKVLIVSSDQDFIQLQKYKNVEQYSPHVRRFLHSDNPERDLLEKIIRGDRGDAIPNFKSDSDTYVNSEKSCKRIYTKHMETWLNEGPDYFCETDEQKKNFERNTNLIDLSKIPKRIEKRILQAYKESKPDPSKSKLHMYFGKHNMHLLMESVHIF